MALIQIGNFTVFLQETVIKHNTKVNNKIPKKLNSKVIKPNYK